MGSLPLSLSSSAAGTPFLLLYLSIFSFIFFCSRNRRVCVRVRDGSFSFPPLPGQFLPGGMIGEKVAPLEKQRIFSGNLFFANPPFPRPFFEKAAKTERKHPNERRSAVETNTHSWLVFASASAAASGDEDGAWGWKWMQYFPSKQPSQHPK